MHSLLPLKVGRAVPSAPRLSDELPFLPVDSAEAGALRPARPTLRGVQLILLLALGVLLSAPCPIQAAARRTPGARRPAPVASTTYSEEQCIQLLQSNSSPTEKDAACARLKFIGTDVAVPTLAALLLDEQLSHSARYALEGMSSPKAGQALRDAMGKATGLTKVGLIHSLGLRADTESVPALAKALSDAHAEVAVAAATALGQIATSEALQALQASAKTPAGPVHDAVVDGCLRCAQHLLSHNNAAKAQQVFQHLFDTERKDAFRLAAYRGLIFASGKPGLALATQAITGKPGPAQTAALQSVHDLNVSGATEAFAQLLSKVGAPIQVALLDGLAQRNDPAAAPAIRPLMTSPDPQVRLACINALGVLGDASSVPLLAASAAATTGTEQAAAREALTQVRQGQVTETLLSQLATAKPAVQAELARALGARSETAAVPKLLVLAQQGSDSARKAATLALGQLVDQAQLASLVQLVLDAKTEDSRSQAAEALNSACQRIQSKRGHLDVAPLVKGLTTGSSEARIALLPVCAAFNDAQVRTALRAATTDTTPQVRAAAIRALCDTTDAELLPDLLKLACSSPEPNLRTLAISGCVRLATQEESVKIPNSQRVDTLKAILAANPSSEQKRVVLAGLAQVPDAAALTLAESLLADSAVQNEAARAIIKIAPLVSDATVADAALKKVVATTQDAPTRQAAEAALRGTATSNDGFITAWQVAGPYEQTGKNFAALLDIAFPPETANAQDTRWTALAPSTDPAQPGIMDLFKVFGGQERVAYAKARVHSDREQPARLELGSDDGIKVWLNQKVVHAHSIARRAKPGSDKVNVTLQSGWNDLLLKVTQHNMGWGFCARLLQPDGSPLTGLQIAPAGTPAQLAAASAASHASRITPQVSPTAFAAAANCDRTFHKVQLTDKFWAEGAAFGDFNHDGKMDIVSGPYWYEGPDFKQRHELWSPTATFSRKKADGSDETIPGFEGALGTKNVYSDCFFDFTYDFNQDGWPDVLVIGFPAKPAAWFENPKGAAGPWPRHEVFEEVGDESPVFADVTGDGKPEILCCARGQMGYLQADWKNPSATWTFHPITPKGPYQKFTHGVGCGDINGDGRIDIIEKDGWWEQPASCAGDPLWTKHAFHFAQAGAQMLVYDVNGDALNDVITCLNAHGYGLAWYEQVRTNGAISFRQHLILNPDATPEAHGFSFTQLHALTLADMNGDGLMDIVTGKRFWAHGKNGHDPESDGFPAVLCWFQLSRSANGQVQFTPHLIDNDSGVGTQVTVGVLNNSKLPGIVVGNKKGLFVFER